jgi:hypothetical protein
MQDNEIQESSYLSASQIAIDGLISGLLAQDC